ncbi:hypothetical protein KDW61_20960 [Burkholderia cenocepacia]|uniref:hypothetical protein n=1 Tax=Burkholderia cenocepacia TaxID=95486 RepID=UPI001B8DDDC6|nr:hypothetical protein [Burkholderia cenocepacia]MBR8211135.1 hypothetical protein [Burkholderia cenocepacia]
MPEETTNSHDFWLKTCGLDTYVRSSGHARVDTPWNAFTHDDQALVCTLWVDCIAEIFDEQEDRWRRFVRLGGKSLEWKGVAIRHGKAAQENLDRANRERLPVFGYEAEPQRGALERGERKVKHFYLNRAHQLQGLFGTKLWDLEQRMDIVGAFRRQGIEDYASFNTPAKLFELVEITANPPHATHREESETNESEDDIVNQEIEGNLTADEYAPIALRLLVAHVLEQQDGVLAPITYKQLAEWLDRRTQSGKAWAKGLGKVLVRVTAIIEQATSHWPERPPLLTSVVVLSTGPDVGLPGSGVDDVWPGYKSLSIQDKRAKVRVEYQRILAFANRWNEILRLANVPEVSPPSGPGQCNAGWGGGESEAHKTLKRFILENPEIVAAPANGFSQEEYALRSGDEIDVMFKSDHRWVGVEVKSRTSEGNQDDYERGLYQVVKYEAVLSAQALVDHPENPPTVEVLLVLESKLPDPYRLLATALGVRYIEGVKPRVAESAD